MRCVTLDKVETLESLAFQAHQLAMDALAEVKWCLSLSSKTRCGARQNTKAWKIFDRRFLFFQQAYG